MFGLNFGWLSDPLYQEWFLRGFAITLLLSVISGALTILIGIIGAAILEFRTPFLAPLTMVLIDLFRNTPPLVQLFFFYFVLSDIGLTWTDPVSGTPIPIFGGFTCVVLSLCTYNGSIAVEVIRSGLAAVPTQTIEGARSLGYSRLQIFLTVQMPMALRMTVPPMTNNVVSIIKTSSQASLVAVTDITYYATQVMLDSFLNVEVMIVLWLIYVAIATVVSLGARTIARGFHIPGYGVLT
ncbi:ABC transporter permease subunit [Nitratireductor aquimarinus]|uniref:amino acid ABC transporter permease n=1 Tax=Nitratireductor TaxID=245876 RepID=UPI0019D3BD79|nr:MULTISPECIES: ABC transporter permease subunit [Nitratireductor]MBN7776620.1 ABC transporter permease subunit [Nitratireductor pacificus]MBN7779487.1 ABC transporter permease subunit [Nitratireductor pacificus]MBN7788294.1 ABC transporter permease subunit [Nitratireductor aquimarinus]MBY6098341.1 ABC transporter permease subunit [Nitratireductor aquimarinus]MCA1261025.1 ABC transporter permease subunit [Nitratireductor aquimarinus]